MTPTQTITDMTDLGPPAGPPPGSPVGSLLRPGSAYPPMLDDLLPRARELAARLGRPPSRNALMRELRVGADKARAVLQELTAADQPRPTSPTSRPTSGPRPGPRSRTATVTALPRPADPAPPPPAGIDNPPGPPAADPGGDLSPALVDAPTDRRPPAAPVAGAQRTGAPVRVWPVLLLALPAFVAIWSGWVGLGGLTGFGVVHPLPGIWDSFAINTAITLPVGMETYAAFALRAWLSGSVPARARRFARWSAIAALALGAAGQVAYHLMTAAGIQAAPWWITTVVACLPVAVLGMGAALAHLLHDQHDHTNHSPGDSNDGGEGSR